jgi:hypothetical protein
VIATVDEAVRETQLYWKALYEEDHLPPPPASHPPSMQQVLTQAPPRPKSREVQMPWETQRPVQEEFISQGERIPVFLQETAGIQEPSVTKVDLSPIRDNSWEQAAKY